VEKFGVEAFDDRLIAVDEFHHVSANPDSRLGDHVRQFMTRDKAHLVAMTGSYFRGDAEAVGAATVSPSTRFSALKLLPSVARMNLALWRAPVRCGSCHDCFPNVHRLA
jgi:hypothetical protein